MTRRILSLFVIVAAIGLLCTSKANAQTTVTSDGVSVRNSQPSDVFFMFPLSAESNVTEFQYVCASGTVNHDTIFVYEEQPSGPQGNFPQIVTYPFEVQPNCNEAYGGHSPNFTFTGSLKNDITVTTPDHTITIKQSTAWTATEYPRAGWKETGGSSQIVVQ